MTIRIGSESFTSKKQACARAAEVLHGHVPMQPITGRDGRFVASLFALHPHAPEKAAPGVHCFVVGPSVHGRGVNLFVVRTDGTFDDFSIRRAVAAAPVTTGEGTSS